MNNIADHWNGTSVKIGRNRSYHLTTSVPDEDRRNRSASAQEALILEAMSRLGSSTGWGLHRHFAGAFLIGSIRRALTNLADRGKLRRDIAVPGPMDHPETLYVYVP